MQETKLGFTLIELLIVVAIIGILAAIAVPNFMNAQARAKIARCQADMKALATAIGSLRVDKNVLPVDIWDGDLAWGKERIEKLFFGIGRGIGSRRSFYDVFAPLTSPVAYMSSIPVDPFAGIERKQLTASGVSTYWNSNTYGYADNDPQDSGLDHGLTAYTVENAGRYGVSALRTGQYLLASVGPDAQYGLGENYDFHPTYGTPFDGSNGTMSRGDIVLQP